MNYQDCLKFFGEFQEKCGVLYDKQGRERGAYNERAMKIQLFTRIYIAKTSICENGWGPDKFQVWDRMKNEKIYESEDKFYCQKYLERYYPNYQNPLEYWE